MPAEGEEGDGVERGFREADEVKPDAVGEHALSRHAEEGLADVVEGCARRDDDEGQPGALEVAVDPVLLERVEREVCCLEDVGLVGEGDPAGEFLLAGRAGAEEDLLLPGADLGRDGADDRGWRGRAQIENDLRRFGLAPSSKSHLKTERMDLVKVAVERVVLAPRQWCALLLPLAVVLVDDPPVQND